MEPQRKNKEQISEKGDEDLENTVWVIVLKKMTSCAKVKKMLDYVSENISLCKEVVIIVGNYNLESGRCKELS